jgi:PKD repeat protein
VAGGAVNFTAAGSSDPEDLPAALKYEWLLNNAVVATGAQASYVFTTAGTFTATLRVTDTKNATATATATVTVSAPPPASATTGTMGIVLTDAPFPFDSVASANMYVVRIDARFAEPTEADLAAPVTGDPSTGWVTVVTVNQRINVLELQNGQVRSLGAKTDMRAGNYRGFRIVLDPAQSDLTLRSGGKPALAWGGRTSFKIEPTATVGVAANGVSNVLVDFDLGRSFSMKGATPSAQGFDAAPSLKIVTPQQTGLYSGIRLLGPGGTAPVEGASIEVLVAGTAESDMSRDKIVATGASDANGTFVIANLQPGAYAVRITPPIRLNYNPIFIASTEVRASSSASASVSTTRVVRFEALP